MNKRILPLVLFLILPAGFAAGEDLLLTAEQAVELALAANPDIRKQRIDFQALQRRYANSPASFMPSLTLSGGFYLPSAGSSPWRSSLSASLSLGLTADQFFARPEARHNLRQGELDYSLTRARIYRDVKKAFYRLLIQEEEEALRRQNIATAKERYDIAEADFRQGRISQYELLSARLSYVTLIPELEDFIITARLEREKFARLIGLPEGTGFKLSGTLDIDASEVSPEKVFAELAGHPSLMKQETTLLQRELALKKLRNRYFPRLNATVTPSLVFPQTAAGGNTPSPFSLGGASGNYLSFTVSADLLELLPWSEQRERVLSARETIEKAEIDRLSQIRETEATVKTLLAKLEKAKQDMEIYRFNLDLAEEFYRITVLEYNAGRQDLLALRDADSRRLKARVDLLNRRAVYVDILLELEYWTGVSFF